MGTGSRVAISIIVAVAMGAFGASWAGAAKLPQQGAVEEDSDASVELVVIKEGGKAKSVKGIKIKDLAADCDGEDQEVDLKLFGAARVSRTDRGFERGYDTGEGGSASIEGVVSRSSRSVSGRLFDVEFDTKELGACEIREATFKTKALKPRR